MAKFTTVDTDNDGMLSRAEFNKMGEQHYARLGELDADFPYALHGEQEHSLLTCLG